MKEKNSRYCGKIITTKHDNKGGGFFVKIRQAGDSFSWPETETSGFKPAAKIRGSNVNVIQIIWTIVYELSFMK